MSKEGLSLSIKHTIPRCHGSALLSISCPIQRDDKEKVEHGGKKENNNTASLDLSEWLTQLNIEPRKADK